MVWLENVTYKIVNDLNSSQWFTSSVKINVDLFYYMNNVFIIWNDL